MTSTPTNRLRLDKQAPGDNPDAWGERLNAALDMIDEAVGGFAEITVDGNKKLDAVNFASDQARRIVLRFIGPGGYAVTIPAVEKMYYIDNRCPADVVLKTASTNGASVIAGSKRIAYCDGATVTTDTSGGIGSASTIAFDPSGSLIATNIQDALEELDSEKASLGQSVSFSQVEVTSQGTASGLVIGDDATMGDINVPNTIGIRGRQDATQGFLSFGSSVARFGIQTFTWLFDILDIELKKVLPSLRLHYPGIRIWDIRIRPDGNLNLDSNDGNARHTFYGTGEIGTAFYGKLSDYFVAKAQIPLETISGSKRLTVNGLKTLYSSIVISTDTLGNATIVYPWAFTPGGEVPTIIASHGDFITDQGGIIISVGGVTTSGFTVHAETNQPDLVRNKMLRINYIAAGL